MASEAATWPLLVPRTSPCPPEGDSAWPSQGKWTYEDYKRLPDDGRRYEIIDGVLYASTAPTFDHQYTVMRLAFFLSDFVIQHQLGIVMKAPFEVHLPGIARPVQPDVFFITAAHLPSLGATSFTGTPELIAEVLSLSTARTDRVVKFSAYERAGVCEYWLVDPCAHSVEVYSRSEEGVYGMDGQYITGEIIMSTVLNGLALSLDELFAHE